MPHDPCPRGPAVALMVVLLSMGPRAAVAEDWPQFRGPTGQGHSTERGLPLSWSETEHVVWKSRVPGLGWSSPVVADGRVWVTTAREATDGSRAVSLRALAFDAESGDLLIDTEVFRVESLALTNSKNSLASPTPVLSGGRVFVHFGAEGTAALTSEGDLIWKTRLPYRSQHGNGGSPVVYDDLLIVNCDGSDRAFVVALDVDTGEVRWKTDRRRPYDQAYSTPLVVHVDGHAQVVSVGAHRATAYDPASGEEIWRVGYPNGFSNVPRPVYGHGLVFLATGFQEPSLLAVRVDGRGDVTRSHVAWALRRGAPYTPSPLLVGDVLYFVSDIGVATAVDAETGAIHWQHRLGGNYSASPVFADGRIYFQSEDGRTVVVEPGTSFQRLGINQIDGLTFASPAVADGAFFLRSHTHLYRVAGS